MNEQSPEGSHWSAPSDIKAVSDCEVFAENKEKTIGDNPRLYKQQLVARRELENELLVIGYCRTALDEMDRELPDDLIEEVRVWYGRPGTCIFIGTRMLRRGKMMILDVDLNWTAKDVLSKLEKLNCIPSGTSCLFTLIFDQMPVEASWQLRHQNISDKDTIYLLPRLSAKVADLARIKDMNEQERRKYWYYSQ